jgi:hypothetical protein
MSYRSVKKYYGPVNHKITPESSLTNLVKDSDTATFLNNNWAETLGVYKYVMAYQKHC